MTMAAEGINTTTLNTKPMANENVLTVIEDGKLIHIGDPMLFDSDLLVEYCCRGCKIETFTLDEFNLSGWKLYEPVPTYPTAGMEDLLQSFADNKSPVYSYNQVVQAMQRWSEIQCAEREREIAELKADNELKESQRKEWADMCIKKQARIEMLESGLEKLRFETFTDEDHVNGFIMSLLKPE